LNDDPRTTYPHFEAVLGQGNIHDCVVELVQGPIRRKYYVGCRDRPDRPINEALRAVYPAMSVKYELVVMRIGMRQVFVRLSRQAERRLAQQAVRG
jgi:hypothetical protein